MSGPEIQLIPTVSNGKSGDLSIKEFFMENVEVPYLGSSESEQDGITVRAPRQSDAKSLSF